MNSENELFSAAPGIPLGLSYMHPLFSDNITEAACIQGIHLCRGVK